MLNKYGQQFHQYHTASHQIIQCKKTTYADENIKMAGINWWMSPTLPLLISLYPNTIQITIIRQGYNPPGTVPK